MKAGRKAKKGFTLIELIVVLVIMAILAAAAIPTMMGYVEEARASQHLAEGRSVYVAATAAATEAIGKYGKTPTGFTVGMTGTYAEGTTAAELLPYRVQLMCKDGLPAASSAKITLTEQGKVTKVEYYSAATDAEHYKVTLDYTTTELTAKAEKQAAGIT